MYVEQAAIWLHTGRIHRIYRPRLYRPILVMLLFLVRVPRRVKWHVWKEWSKTPRGTVPWLWRAFMGRYERVPVGGDMWSNNVTRNDGRLSFRGGIVRGSILREKFWSRIAILSILIMWYLTDWQWLTYFGLMGATRTWNGSGGDNLATTGGNWVGGVAPASNADKAIFDSTGTKACTWDVAAIGEIEIVDDGGYTGLISMSVNVLIDNAGAHNGNLTVGGDGSAAFETGSAPGSGNNLTVTGTTIAGSSTVSGGTLIIYEGAHDFQGAITITSIGAFQALADVTAACTMTAISITNNNAFDIFGDSTNAFILQRDASNFVIWSGNAPDVDAGGLNSLIQFGNGTNRGVDFATNNVNVTTGGAGVTLDLVVNNNFNDLTISSGDTVDINASTTTNISGDLTITGTLDPNAETLTCEGDFLAEDGTITAGLAGSLLQMTGTTAAVLQFGNNSWNVPFEDITLGDGSAKTIEWRAGTVGAAERYIRLRDGNFLINSLCIVQMNDNGFSSVPPSLSQSSLEIFNTSIPLFKCNGTIELHASDSGFSTLMFRRDTNGTDTITDWGSGTIDVPISFVTSGATTQTTNINVDLNFGTNYLQFRNNDAPSGTYNLGALTDLVCGDLFVYGGVTGSFTLLVDLGASGTITSSGDTLMQSLASNITTLDLDGGTLTTGIFSAGSGAGTTTISSSSTFVVANTVNCGNATWNLVDLTMTTGTLNPESAAINCSGNWNTNGVIYNSSTETVAMSGTGTFVAGSLEVFTGTLEVSATGNVTQNTNQIIVTGTFHTISGGVWDVNVGTRLNIRDGGIPLFDNEGTISGSGSSLEFRTSSASQTLTLGSDGTGNTGVITISTSDFVFDAGSSVNITLGDIFTTTGAIQVSESGAASPYTLVTAGYNVTAVDFIVAAGDTQFDTAAGAGGTTTLTLTGTFNLFGLTVTAGNAIWSILNLTFTTGTFNPNSANITCSGDWNTSGNTYNSSTETITMSGTAKNFTTNGGEGFNGTLEITGTITQTTSVSIRGTFHVTSSWSINTTRTLQVENAALSLYDNEGTVTGAGTVKFVITGASQTLTEGSNGNDNTGITSVTLTEFEFQTATGDIILGDIYTTTGDIDVIVNGAGSTDVLVSDGYNITADNITINLDATLDIDEDAGMLRQTTLQQNGAGLLTVSVGGALTTGNGIIRIDDDMTIAAGAVFTGGTGDQLEFTTFNDTHTFRLDAPATFSNVTYNGSTAITRIGSPALNILSSCVIAAGKTIDDNGGGITEIQDDAIAGWSLPSDATYNKLSNSLTFQYDLGVDKSLNPSGTIVGDVRFRNTTASARITTLITAAALNWPGAVINTDRTSSGNMTLDTGGLPITCINITVIDTGIDASSGGAITVSGNLIFTGSTSFLTMGSNIVSISGDVDMTPGTFTQGTSAFRLFGNGPNTFQVGTNSGSFFDFVLGQFADINFTSSATTMTLTGDFLMSPDSTFTVVDSNSILTIVPTVGDDHITFNSTSVIDGAGKVLFEDATGVTYTLNTASSVHSINWEFTTLAGSSVVNMGTDFSITTGALIVGSSVTVDSAGFDLTSNGAGTITGTLQEIGGTGSQTWILGIMTVTGTFTFDVTVAGTVIDVDRISCSAGTVIVKGDNLTNLVTMQGFINNGLNFSGGTGHIFRYCTINGASASTFFLGTGGAGDGTVQFCTVGGTEPFATHVTSSVADWDILDCDINGRNTFRGVSANFVMKNCHIRTTGSGVGLDFPQGAFAGRIENCTLNYSGTVAGIRITTNPVLGSIVNCSVINDGSGFDVSVSAAFTGELIGCIFDSGNVSVPPTAELFSYQHNRTNQTEVFIGGDTTVDSSFQSVVHADTFDWDFSASNDWNIGGGDRNRMIATGNVGVMTSVFIPVNVSTTYFLRYKGDVDSVVVQGYKVDQFTPTVVNTVFVASGDDFEATLIGDVDTAFIQFQVDAAALGEEFYDIEVREGTDATGPLVWNEDFINHYIWPDGVDYLNNQLSFDASDRVVLYGDIEYNRMDRIMTIDGFAAASDVAGFIFAYGDSNNHYRVYLDGTTPSVIVEKVVAGIVIPIDSALTAGGSALPTGDDIDFQVRWNEDIAGLSVPGAFSVKVNGVTVNAASDWVSGGGGGDYSVLDTTFTEGPIAYFGNGVSIDNIIDQHHGLCVVDADLTLGSGVDITLAPDGIIKLKDVVVNSTRASVINLGGLLLENNVTWQDDSFNESVISLINLKCVNIEVDNDIVLGLNGSLNLTGVTFRHAVPDTPWRLITEASTVDPPVISKGVRMYDVTPRIREMKTLGEVYELDKNGPAKESIVDGAEPEIDPNVTRQRSYGREGDRNIITGFGDHEVTLTFFAHDDMCLYGMCEDWMLTKELLEVVYNRGYLRKVKIIGVTPARSSNANIRLVQFAVTFEEFK